MTDRVAEELIGALKDLRALVEEVLGERLGEWHHVTNSTESPLEFRPSGRYVLEVGLSERTNEPFALLRKRGTNEQR